MPFTFSHPAIILPLYRYSKWFSMTGLIVGSMSPDFEYYIRMRMFGVYGHACSGICLLNILTGLAVAFIFHLIIRNPLIRHLPAGLQRRFNVYLTFNWTLYFCRHYLIVVFSLFLGSLSHIFWDAFTHPSGWFVSHSLWLQQEITLPFLQPLPVYKLLQHGSSVTGLLCIAAFIWCMPQSNQPVMQINYRYWLLIAVFALVIASTRISFNPDCLRSGHLIVTIIMSLFISTIVTSLYFHRSKYHELSEPNISNTIQEKRRQLKTNGNQNKSH
ncbi:MAG: DUF4184 family protein [Snodgrassella sp.]|uniref:DUF4184 family protein n=1 Tax=Snodgrassella sp. TaxID=2815304 RepID=UPI00258C5869|nr:DUF4184 family protein [Snodgrassella sp.]MCO6508979.1 DUF4184 family protein [Snodgrassella sp.]